jgi:predicted DNA-binding transcriptional regulator AlpA
MNATADLGDVCKLLADLRDRLDAHTRPPAELLTRDDLAALLAVGVSTLDRLRAGGAIGPKPLELSGVKWSRAEVLAWLAHRDRTGELLDAGTWPAVWRSIRDRTPSR